MQRFSMTLALALAAAAPSWAEAPAPEDTATPAPATAPAPGATAMHHRDMMVEKLQLKPDQAQKFRDIMDEKRQRRRAIMSENKDATQKQGELNALHDEIHQKLAAVLTPDQLSHYEQMRSDRPHSGHGPRRRGAHAHSTPPASGTQPDAAQPAAPTPN